MEPAAKVYLSSSYVRGRPIGEVLAALGGQGITGIELSGGAVWSNDIAEVVVRKRREFGLKYQVHNYFPPAREEMVLNIVAPDPAERRASHDFVRRSLDLVQELGLSLYSVHAGYLCGLRGGKGHGLFRRTGIGQISRRQGRKVFLDAVAELAAEARRRGIRLAVENLFPFGESGENISLLCHADEILWFLESFTGADDVGLLLDLGHLHIAAKSMGFKEEPFLRELVRTWKSKLLAIHVSHNRGVRDEHRPIPARATPASPDGWVLRNLEILEPAGTITTLEIRQGTIQQIKSSLAMISSVTAVRSEPAAPR